MNRLCKALNDQARKAKFAVGKSPLIEKKTNGIIYIPSHFKSVLLITADFELAWAWRYSKSSHSIVEHALSLARQERANIPEILHLCDQFNMPITWATVGHLFLDSCCVINGCKHPEIPRISQYRGPFWDFEGVDWFEHDPCSNLSEAPEWYAADLIQQILDSRVRHEIGCHTFSHIDCREEVCPPDLILSEIRSCKDLASLAGFHLKSFVHPGYTIGNLGILRDEGFTSYQTDPGNILGYPEKKGNGLWEFKRTYEFVWRKEWSLDYHLYLYKTIIDRAIKTNTVCNFWFHPSLPLVFVKQVLPAIFEHIDNNRNSIYLTTISDYVDWLQNQL